MTYGDGEGSKLFIEDFFVKIPSLGTKFSVRTHYSRAAMGQNCSLFDKSMKLFRIVKVSLRGTVLDMEHDILWLQFKSPNNELIE